MIDGIKIFDAHTHYAGRFKKREETFIEFLDRYSIDKAIVTSINTTTTMDTIHKISEASKETFTEEFDLNSQLDHTEVLKLVKTNPDRLTGFYWFNPKKPSEENWQTLEKYIRVYHFKGVKTQPCVNLLKIPEDLFLLAEFCIEYDIPLYIHSGIGFFFQKAFRARDIYKLAVKYPELKLIIGHMGYTMEYAINNLNYFTKRENVYFETSLSVPYAIVMIIKAMGEHRVLYGSDAPTATTPDIEINKIRILNLETKALENVFYNNISALLKMNK